MERAEDQVPGHRRLNRVFRRFKVANFPDENDVRVVAQDRAQTRRERQTDFRVNLNLVDAVQLVFDRVFRRDDFRRFRLNLVQRAVKRRRLPGTGRAGNQNDAVRKRNQLPERLVDVFVHPDPAERKVHAVFVENTHNDSFAVKHRNDRNAEVDFAVGNLNLNTTVLRNPLFGDVQARHNLQTADDRRLETVDFRRRRLRLEDAVDAVPDFHPGFLRLDVNVARAGFDRFGQDVVDEPNDRRFLRHRRVAALVPVDVFENFDVLRLLHQAVDRFRADAETRLDQFRQFARKNETRNRRKPGRGGDFVDGRQVERVARRDEERAVFLPSERENVAAVNEFDREIFQHVARNLRFRDVDDRNAEFRRDRDERDFLVARAELVQRRLLKTVAVGERGASDAHLNGVQFQNVGGFFGKNDHRSGLLSIFRRLEKKFLSFDRVKRAPQLVKRRAILYTNHYNKERRRFKPSRRPFGAFPSDFPLETKRD